MLNHTKYSQNFEMKEIWLAPFRHDKMQYILSGVGLIKFQLCSHASSVEKCVNSNNTDRNDTPSQITIDTQSEVWCWVGNQDVDPNTVRWYQHKEKVAIYRRWLRSGRLCSIPLPSTTRWASVAQTNGVTHPKMLRAAKATQDVR